MSSDHDNEQAAMLMHCFTAFFRDEAFKLGFSVDMTHDLSRVFRFPNCWNAKEVPHVETRMLECNTLRYEPADIVSAIPKEVIERTREERKTVKKYTETSKALIGDEFTINQDADPPWDKLSVLCINDPTFQATWNYNRKDLKDSSPSGYDMALASIASRNGWAKQEMCDMLIAFRKKHNLPSKVHRLDYYQTTLNKAYIEGQQTLAKELMRDAIVGSVALESMPESDRKKKLLEALSTSLNVKILKILKYRVDPPEYRIETTTGGVDLGTVKGLTSQTSLRNAIADATGYWFPLMKSKDWDNVVQIMLNLCQDEDVGEESTDKGRVRQWLAGYLMEKQRQISTFDTDTAASQGIPYIAHGKLFLFGPSLRDWLMIMHKETVSMKDMGKKLRLYGCSPEKINFKLDGQVYGRSAWSLPVTDSLVSRLNGGGSSSSSTPDNRHEEEKSTTYIAANAEPATLQ
jgi:hypothetical protein